MPNTVAQINRLALSDTASKLPGVARHHYADSRKDTVDQHASHLAILRG